MLKSVHSPFPLRCSLTGSSDVLSLVVALYTIKLATSPSSAKNSYGWQRAEILGALINGVFLVALCVSIALEALGRIISPPEISNPMIIVIVGSLGLLSNIVGLFLFHGELHASLNQRAATADLYRARSFSRTLPRRGRSTRRLEHICYCRRQRTSSKGRFHVITLSTPRSNSSISHRSSPGIRIRSKYRRRRIQWTHVPTSSFTPPCLKRFPPTKQKRQCIPS